jgi:hypothetical protein
MQDPFVEVDVVRALSGIGLVMFVSAPRHRLLLREDVRQLVLPVVPDEAVDAHIFQQLLRGLSVDSKTNCINSGLGSCLGWKLP